MAGLAFHPGDMTGRNDLSIHLVGPDGRPTNPFIITYSLNFVDPGPPEVEVPIGDPARKPVNPSVGEFYAAIVIPTGAQLGTYRIRWLIKQTVASPDQTVVQEFQVSDAKTTVTALTPMEARAVWELRVLLRDQCVGGEAEVELEADGERVLVRLDELYEVLADLQVPTP